MKLFHRYIIFRIFCLLLALQIFNVSVDSPDIQPDYVPEDLTLNDQESFVELLIEKVCGMGNVIKEHDDPDNNCDGMNMIKVFKINSNFISSLNITQFCGQPVQKSIPQRAAIPEEFAIEIIPPPPRQ